MIKFATILSFIIVMFAGCKKEKDDSSYMNTATIIAPDPRMGPCTGGTFISIDRHPNPNSYNGYYDNGSLPSTFKIKFPQRVSIDWRISDYCFGNYVDIIRIREN